ncbi:chloride anion exchanger-like isoform X2 [Mytilus edulis]|uniref:chloride anion exchanger-like isoform X2 n=1 Tax=Mytilus edulis TaxID=6550 RepID=UPI0039EFF88D
MIMAEPETDIQELTANEDTGLHRVVDFNAKYYKQKTDEKICDRIKKHVKKYSSLNYMKSCVFSNVPIIQNLRKYNLRKYLVSDILSGITVGIMQIPQGMAFGLLTTLPPICGMYTAFFGPLTYFFLGSSRHLSVGAVAVVSLMMASVIDVAMQENNLYAVTESSTNISTDDIINKRKIEIATSVSFVSGLFMILLGKLKFGLISTYMSEQLVSGFTAAVAIHITTSQAKHIFGISVPQHNGIFKVIKTWRDVCYNIPSTNFATLITTVICFIILYLVKVQINMRFKSRLKMPIPIELIIISIATGIAHFAEFNQRFNINILKDIPAGLPSPVLPNPVIATDYIADAFIIGIVAFTHSVSGARLLARKHNYEIDPNQELVASGAGSVVCSIFSGYINAGSLSRTMVLDGTNGKSQCVLSAVIIINLRTMFIQILEVPSLWRTSKYDFVIWMVTFLTSSILDVDIGIASSLIFSLLTVSLRTQSPSSYTLGFVGKTNQLKSVDRYDPVVTPDNVRIVQFQAPIYFANADIFVKSVVKLTGIDPVKARMKQKQFNQIETNISPIDVTENCDLTMQIESKMSENFVDGVEIVILDFSGVNFVDIVGIKALKRVYTDYNSIGIQVFIASCNDSVTSMMTSTDFMKDYEETVYLTVNCILTHKKLRSGLQV